MGWSGRVNIESPFFKRLRHDRPQLLQFRDRGADVGNRNRQYQCPDRNQRLDRERDRQYRGLWIAGRPGGRSGDLNHHRPEGNGNLDCRGPDRQYLFCRARFGRFGWRLRDSRRNNRTDVGFGPQANRSQSAQRDGSDRRWCREYLYRRQHGRRLFATRRLNFVQRGSAADLCDRSRVSRGDG